MRRGGLNPVSHEHLWCLLVHAALGLRGPLWHVYLSHMLVDRELLLLSVQQLMRSRAALMHT